MKELKKRLQHRCFPKNWAKFFKKIFYRTLPGTCFCNVVVDRDNSSIGKNSFRLSDAALDDLHFENFFYQKQCNIRFV